jgi:rfaE bifunctional protein nucleotidyltransferase chain/domain
MNDKTIPPVAKLSDLLPKVFKLKKKGKRIVFTNGCFDLLHLGHVKYLAHAKALGDVLVVAVNSDKSVEQIKGPSRPIIPECTRAGMVAALKPVDHVFIFDDPDPYEIIKKINPDVLVKGGDWTEDTVIGANWVKSMGGKVEIIPYFNGFSTSSIIARIMNLYSTCTKGNVEIS